MPIAPETIVAPPSSGPPLNGLLTSGLVVEDDSRWESGFVFAPECTGSDVWVPCGADSTVIASLGVDATGGTWEFVSGAETSDPLPFDATAAEIEAVLSAFIVSIPAFAGRVFSVSVRGGPVNEAAVFTTVYPVEVADLAYISSAQSIDLTGGSASLGGSLIQAPGVEEPPDVKSEFEGNGGAISVRPFYVEAPYECSSWGFEEADYEGKALRALEATEGQTIEAEWWSGANIPSNQNLRYWTPNDDDHILNPGGAGSPTAVSPSVGLALLEAALASCNYTKGVIHLPIEIGSRVVNSLGIEDIEDGVLRTRARGDLVVIGSGYDGQIGPFGQPPAGDGFAWAYATGPVAVRLGDVEILPETMAEALDRATNTISYRAERTAAVVHDGCCSFAVLIELTPIPTVEIAGG